MNGYRTSFTAEAGKLTVHVDHQSGSEVARFSWLAEETDGALGELAAALDAMGRLQERRRQCREQPKPRRARRPPRGTCEVSVLDGIDQAIELLELAPAVGVGRSATRRDSRLPLGSSDERTVTP